jgi:ligand-binding sensor domain-containing protein
MQNWRIHFSVFNTIAVAETNTNIFMGCSNGIVRYDLEDNTVNQLTVTNGLSDLGISAISADETTAIVGYVSGNLDVIEGSTIINVPWIKKAEISGDKTVHNFYMDDPYIYVATGIGLIVYDRDKQEIKDTYYPYEEPVVYDVTVYNDTLFAATAEGIYFAPKDRPFLNDKNQWEKKVNLPDEVVNEEFNQIESFAGYLFYGYNDEVFNADTIYYETNGIVSRLDKTVNFNSIYADDDRLILSLFSSVVILDTDLEEIQTIFDYPEGSTPSPEATVYSNDNYWIADKNNGLVKAVNTYNAKSIFSNTPAFDGSYRMDIQYGKVVVAGGGLTQNLQNNYFRNGVYVFEDETWTNYNTNTDDLIENDLDWDFISAAVNQNNTDEFAFASFSQGGLKVVKEGGAVSEVYNADNSLIEANAGRMAIPDMKYDDDGNLWFINQGLYPLKVLTPEGTMYQFSLGASSNGKYPYRLLIDNEGNKWVAVTGVGLIAFNDNETLDDPSDDQLQSLTAAEGFGDLPSAFVKGLAQDADGEIWIGTEEGLAILYSRNNLYDGGFGEYDTDPIVFEVDGENERLLGDTYITAIAIDGGNRKWIGTSSSGVFCFSEDGSKEIYRFSEENSPLISNNVLDIKVDQLSGEVYFATEKGLVSFRADASLADREFSNVSVFPNPVYPDFSGPITIQGLGYESDVKVTDISGNLIYKTVSNGGTVIWDGKNLQGERVQSGVYLVWTGITYDKGKNVAKILFIN